MPPLLLEPPEQLGVLVATNRSLNRRATYLTHVLLGAGPCTACAVSQRTDVSLSQRGRLPLAATLTSSVQPRRTVGTAVRASVDAARAEAKANSQRVTFLPESGFSVEETSIRGHD